jgi:hypothetical protein
MIHARSDYMRIQDPLKLIPEDEPVFLIRGQDVNGPAVVECWADLAEQLGASEHIVEAARKQAELMRKYQANHIHKIPDMNKTDVNV